MMEEKRTVFSYIGQIFATFGIIVAIFIIFCLIIGESSGEYSSLFVLGKRGLTLETLSQILLLSVFITAFQALFMTDGWIKDMAAVLRSILFFSSVMIAIIVMVIIFGWFPVNDIQAWIGFIVSYVLCMILSTFITRLREKTENEKMQKALDKYNQRGD